MYTCTIVVESRLEKRSRRSIDDDDDGYCCKCLVYNLLCRLILLLVHRDIQSQSHPDILHDDDGLDDEEEGLADNDFELDDDGNHH